MKKPNWNDFLWVATAIYLALGFFNILFAWIGLLCFFIPLTTALSGLGKVYCNRYCGRGQLLQLLGGKFGFSRGKPIPGWMRNPWFRYGFLVFFMLMFGNMVFSTILVFLRAQDLRQVVTLLWTFKLPWQWAGPGLPVPAWVAQFSFGFYSVMLTSSLLGVVTMLFYKPRSWCVYCPMGTMTQLISKSIYKKQIREELQI